MNKQISIHLHHLALKFTKTQEILPLDDITYFYGQMGAGKSSIARLIDYCLGADLDFSPALQSEFISAALHLFINDKEVSIERMRDSDQVLCSWNDQDGSKDVVMPSRVPDGVVIPDSEVEVLSDFIFYLSNLNPPLVRKSKLKPDTVLERLSIRDLLWFCYLDQDSFDSDFFHLGEDANPFKRLKSRDVLRFILGFHQEEVAALESELQRLIMLRHQYTEAAKSLREALKDVEVGNEAEIQAKIDELKTEAHEVQAELQKQRGKYLEAPHATIALKDRARNIAYEIDALDDDITQVKKIVDQHVRHKNEIVMLGLKVHRVAAARAVLGGVEFTNCPRCAQKLPERQENECTVCGQTEPIESPEAISSEVIAQDSKTRVSELEQSIALHTAQLRAMQRRIEELKEERSRIDTSINENMKRYDSAYLTHALTFERRQAEIAQKIANLELLVILPKKLAELSGNAIATEVEEKRVRKDLEEARKGAESDLTNLTRLQELFLDSLLKAKVPGIKKGHSVRISHKDFLPEVFDPIQGDITVTSFANLSSGGKKTLFKACFAISLHRLAVEVGALLPNLLIIDSPMKNISERENREQFEGFHDLLFQLAAGELSQTQMIIIDKEYCEPAEELNLKVLVRHMMPDSEQYPPLIPYYRGF